MRQWQLFAATTVSAIASVAQAGSISLPLPPLDSAFWCGQTVLCGAPGRSDLDSARLPDSKDQLYGLFPAADGTALAIGTSQASTGEVRVYAQRLGSDGHGLAGVTVVPTAIASIDDVIRDSDGSHVLVLATVNVSQKKILRLNADGTQDGSFGTLGIVTYTRAGTYSNTGRGQILRRAADGHLLLFVGVYRGDLTFNGVDSEDFATSQSAPSGDLRLFGTSSGVGGNVDLVAAAFGPNGDAVVLANDITGSRALTLFQPSSGPSQSEKLSIGMPASASCAAIGGGSAFAMDAIVLPDGRLLAVGAYGAGFAQNPFAMTASLAAANFGGLQANCDAAANAGYLTTATLVHPYGVANIVQPLAVQFDSVPGAGSVKRLRYTRLSGNGVAFGPLSDAMTWPNSTTGQPGETATLLGGVDVLVEGSGRRVWLGTSRRYSGNNYDFAFARYAFDGIFFDDFEPESR